VHVVEPDADVLKQRIIEGYRFIAYSIDAVFLRTCAEKPGPSGKY
jgi:2-dehydro-3-deoxyglucarate aldolase